MSLGVGGVNDRVTGSHGYSWVGMSLAEVDENHLSEYAFRARNHLCDIRGGVGLVKRLFPGVRNTLVGSRVRQGEDSRHTMSTFSRGRGVIQRTYTQHRLTPEADGTTYAESNTRRGNWYTAAAD